MSLSKALKNTTTTTNGMAAFKSTNSKVLDLFSKIGSARGTDISSLFLEALAENQELAIRTLLWARDVRGGSGERDTFRKLVNLIDSTHTVNSHAFMCKVAEVGRWDDLLVFITHRDNEIATAAKDTIIAAFNAGNGLAAKWMPRQGNLAYVLRKHAGIESPKQWRKLLVGLSNTVEQKMCAKDWSGINYSHVPSVAAKNYSKAFARNDNARYQEYLDMLSAGSDKVKVNASAIFPYDVLRGSNTQLMQSQWDSLPNYLEGVDTNILPLIDVSGSMETRASESLTCMDIAVSLGIYLSQRIKGDFKDTFITFETRPSLVELRGNNIHEISRNVHRASWGGSTNYEAVFDLVLAAAKRNKVKPEDMPTSIVVFSDMQFNGAMGDVTCTAHEMVEQKYKDAGYKMPSMVYWNLNASYNNSPVTMHQEGTVSVSGFSPALMSKVFKGDLENITPYAMMLDVIMADRYAFA